MNLRVFFAAVFAFSVLSAAAVAQTSSDANEGSQLKQSTATGAYTFSWWGMAGRTYFLQQSDDLINWTYLPVIESGLGDVIQWGYTSSASRSFMRLEPTDIPTADPFNDDFNDDGLSNWQNLEQGSDPLAPAVLDTNGLPINWEQFYNISAGTDPNALAPRGDGLSYLQAFEQGLNPNDYYNGQSPTLTIANGNNQTGPPNGFVPLPLIVSVTDANENPYIGAPVTFAVGQGGGQVQATSIASSGTTITVLTDVNGHAQVFFRLPNAASSTSQVIASTGGGSPPAQATFTEFSDDGSGSFASPFDPSNVVATMNADGSADVSWTNNADPADTETIDIMYKDKDGAWQVLSNVPAGTTSYHIPAP